MTENLIPPFNQLPDDSNLEKPTPGSGPNHYHSFNFGRQRPVSFWTWSRVMLVSFFFSMSLASGVTTAVVITYLGEIPLVSDLKAYRPSLSTKIYDVRGDLITELFSEQRTLINLDDVPKQLQQAILAIEDNNFYQHFGIQFSGILRSFMVNFLHKGYKQGGSTITQQLARNMFLTREKTIARKLKEIILAFQIERTYSKREILEMYFNQIYFGNGAHGIESAARTYFGKHVYELNLPECALLAGLPRAPNAYNPYRNPENAKHRRDLVLTQMQRFGYLSPEETETAQASSINLSSVDVSEAPYFVEYVRRQLEDRFGSTAIYNSGLLVYTTLDLTLQRYAEAAMNEGIAEAEKIIVPQLHTLQGQKPETLQCALLMVESSSGEIKALIGGRDFVKSKFNRAVQAQRQPGSAFKPLIYATALTLGYTQAEVILDTPVVFKDDQGQVWKPENFDNQFRGPTCLRDAIMNSRNVVTVKLLDKIGAKNVIALAGKLGIRSSLKPYLTLALGASEINMLELVSAFSCFPNRGIRIQPYSIRRVEDNSGQILEENIPLRQEALDESTAAIMVNLLENVVNHGTGYPVRRLGFTHPAGGKTGTTNDFTDAWFVGFTSDYTTGVWMGLDSHNSLGRGITGGQVASPIWAKFMLQTYAGHAPKSFRYPETVEQVRFCRVSGLLPNPTCPSKSIVQGAFAIGTAPTQTCDVHLDPGLGVNPAYNLNVSPDLVDLNKGTDSPDTVVEDSEAPPQHPGTLPTPPPPPIDNSRPPIF